MNTSSVFRRTLATRILSLIAVSLPAAACGALMTEGTSIDDCNPSPIYTERCFVPSDDGAPFGSTADGGAFDASASDGGASDGGASPLVCPSRDNAREPLARTVFGRIDDVKSDGMMKDGRCCYDVVWTSYCEGRPYLVEAVPQTAAGIRGVLASNAYLSDARLPCVDDLAPTLRAVLAAEWTRDALFEHASVASFGRFALELLAVGAPADLLEEAHQAALDELRHARLCFGLASAYAGEAIAPGPFPFEGRVEVSSDLASIAARAVREGCIGETVAASVAAEQLAVATDPAVRAALATIAADEARHAELAWRFVAWAVRTGGSDVSRAVADVFATMPTFEFPASSDEDLSAHGRLGREQLHAASSRAIDEIVRPAARALLAARSSPPADLARIGAAPRHV